METIKIDKNELLKLYNCPENIKPYIYGNRLIGLFMGKTHLNKLTILYSLKYHESWDWLMPVVERIESLDPLGGIVTIVQGQCKITSRVLGDNSVYANINNYGLKRPWKIIAVYEAVIMYINWYNNNKPKE